MSRKSVISIITALIMAFSVCIFIPQEVDAATSNQSLYWLKVNRKANVVTAYKLREGKYVPYRAMVCSTGAPESKTPLMDTRIKGRWRWGYLW